MKRIFQWTGCIFLDETNICRAWNPLSATTIPWCSSTEDGLFPGSDLKVYSLFINLIIIWYIYGRTKGGLTWLIWSFVNFLCVDYKCQYNFFFFFIISTNSIKYQASILMPCSMHFQSMFSQLLQHLMQRWQKFPCSFWLDQSFINKRANQNRLPQ